ncbi:MAG TPA: DUF2855 family protein [Myxococcales bacterium]|nr:DUF2855 family protein [Myxococcales bacterium]HIK86468.1 DUF2855 family protein [Myxococcales bacterium]
MMSENELAPIDFLINRDDFRDCRFVPGSATHPLEPGQVLFRVDRFALTSNNITYAAAGDLLNYWGFFPGPDRWGRIPAMGFGDVIDSRNEEVQVGTRCFGFFPMSRHLIVDAKPNGSGIVDTVAHRASQAPVYRTYNYTTADALYSQDREDQIMLLRGLFMTSFLVDDLFDDEDFYGAESSIITSASSKTSIALGFLLKRRARGPVIGLTSERNRDFVTGLGCYDEVITYDQLSSLPSERPAVMIDMAGNGEVVAAIHERLRDQLKYSCAVGGTHWESKPKPDDLPGPQPEFFFAPARIVKRSEDWGGAGLQERLGSAWSDFLEFSDQWLSVSRHHGPEALERVYLDVLTGRIDPSDGHVISL